MGKSGKTEFEFLDFYHERVEKWRQAQANAIAVELAKEEAADAASAALFNDRLNALGRRPSFDDPNKHVRESLQIEQSNVATGFREKISLLRKRMNEFTDTGYLGLTSRRAGLLVQLSEMTHEGWEIVSCHGSDEVSVGHMGGGSSHNILILLRRNVGE
jgi:hypothetical protein